jgi:hypothetical protein
MKLTIPEPNPRTGQWRNARWNEWSRLDKPNRKVKLLLPHEREISEARLFWRLVVKATVVMSLIWAGVILLVRGL